MHIVCPVSSSQQIPGGPSNHVKRLSVGHINQQDANHKRVRNLHRAAKLKEVGEAKRKDEKKKQVRRPAAFNHTHVYIGNLESSITQARLEAYFKDCGRIRTTIIRCSRGQALTVGVAVPLAVRSARDRMYASMEFYDTKSALNALKYNDTVLDGCQLVVSASAADLPEVMDIVRPHLQNMRQRDQQTRPLPPSRFSRPRPLVRNDTQRDFTDPKNDRIRIFGFSFNKCIL
ncbi:hypothetical protein BDZ97DRAFT_9375 [Flammula alnicola]|nr:hypothetical protein BDZ97DRAFT_9375 [Flammula alnicola]